MENFTRAGQSNLSKPLSWVGHTPLSHGVNAIQVAMRTFENCDVEPINNLFEPTVVYRK